MERPGHRPVAVDAVRLFWTLPVTDSGPVCACVCHAAAPAEACLHRRPPPRPACTAGPKPHSSQSDLGPFSATLRDGVLGVAAASVCSPCGHIIPVPLSF